jgi:plastocyanin
MQRAFLSPGRRAMAGAVILLVAVGLIGTVLVLRPTGQAQGTATATPASSESTLSTYNVSEAKTFYVQINCGAVAVCSGGFMPQNLTIPAGSRVIWTSRENPELYIYHRVVFPVGGWDSGPLNGEDTYAATFPSPGVYPYYDSNFPGNNGTITVVPAG